MEYHRKFGLIGTCIWQSECFRSLKKFDARLAYFWLHTSQSTHAGILRISPAYLLEETDLVRTIERAREIFHEMERAGLIVWTTPYVILLKYLRTNTINSENHLVAAFKEVLDIPDCVAKRVLFCDLCKHKYARKMVSWRSAKTGEPHDVVHRINAYIEEHEIGVFDGIVNPLPMHWDAIDKPSGKKEKEKEKKNPFKEPEVQCKASGAPHHSHAANESIYCNARPRPETMRLVEQDKSKL